MASQGQRTQERISEWSSLEGELPSVGDAYNNPTAQTNPEVKAASDTLWSLWHYSGTWSTSLCHSTVAACVTLGSPPACSEQGKFPGVSCTLVVWLVFPLHFLICKLCSESCAFHIESEYWARCSVPEINLNTFLIS